MDKDLDELDKSSSSETSRGSPPEHLDDLLSLLQRHLLAFCCINAMDNDVVCSSLYNLLSLLNPNFSI